MNGVSLVICCHNSSRRLAETLTHVARQRNVLGIPWEVIVVDNASTDSTYELACKLTVDAKYDRKIAREDEIGLTHARLRGIAESRYEYISFIDDDNWVGEDWIERCYEIMSHDPTIGACGGLNTAVFESAAPFWFDACKQYFAVGPQGGCSGYVPDARGSLFGAGLTIRRSAWLQLYKKGFSLMMPDRKGQQLGSGGDAELCYALRLLGWRLWYDERLKLKHCMATTRLDWGYLRKLMRATGRTTIPLAMYKKIPAQGGNNTVFDRPYLLGELKRMGSILYHCKLLVPFFRHEAGCRQSLQAEYYVGCILELLSICMHPAAAQKQFAMIKLLAGAPDTVPNSPRGANRTL